MRDLLAEWLRDDAGTPLGFGPSGSPLRVDGDTHRQGWMRVLRRDPCAFCDLMPGEALCSLTPSPVGSVDHIDPKSSPKDAPVRGPGGAHSWTNYAGVCDRCNSKKGDKSLLAFMAGRRGVVMLPKRRRPWKQEEFERAA